MPDTPHNPQTLIQHLAAMPKGDASYPNPETDYHKKALDIIHYLNEKVHKEVNRGATANSPSKKKRSKGIAPAEPPWLTDHGPEHIATVIRRAEYLLGREPALPLMPYESFVLLMAIHFHDVGNIFGRQEHERRIDEVMRDNQLSALLGDDGIERKMIRDIAMAHGGSFNGSKDTIGPMEYPWHPGPREVRVRLLAAILRFADELADDHTRTSRFLLGNKDLINPGSEMYHLYADRLQRVKVDHASEQISLVFQLNPDVSMRRLKKDAKSDYLFNEILSRTLKMHREHVYCSRFMHPIVNISRIHVEIQLCSADYMTVYERISYQMQESGYPQEPRALPDICPETKGLTGATIRNRYRGFTKSGKSS